MQTQASKFSLCLNLGFSWVSAHMEVRDPKVSTVNKEVELSVKLLSSKHEKGRKTLKTYQESCRASNENQQAL